MKALTVCQPYAELIAREGSWRGPIVRGFEKIHYPKRIENRTWPTSYRGELAIHAGKSRAFMLEPDALMDQYGLEEGDMAFGAVIAVVNVVDCVAFEELRKVRTRPDDWYLMQYAEGPWCWILADVRRIVPIPAQGRQGLWDFDGGKKIMFFGAANGADWPTCEGLNV